MEEDNKIHLEINEESLSKCFERTKELCEKRGIEFSQEDHDLIDKSLRDTIKEFNENPEKLQRMLDSAGNLLKLCEENGTTVEELFKRLLASLGGFDPDEIELDDDNDDQSKPMSFSEETMEDDTDDVFERVFGKPSRVIVD